MEKYYLIEHTGKGSGTPIYTEIKSHTAFNALLAFTDLEEFKGCEIMNVFLNITSKGES
jgi:hypothetical protein